MSTDNFNQPGQPPQPPAFPGYTPSDPNPTPPPGYAPSYGTPSFPPAGTPNPNAPLPYTPPATPMDLPPAPSYGAGPSPADSAGTYGTPDPGYTAQPSFPPAPGYGQSQPSQYATPDYGQTTPPPAYAPTPDFGQYQTPYAGAVNPYASTPYGYQLSTWGKRALGALIDYVAPGMVAGIIATATMDRWTGNYTAPGILADLLLVAYIVYNTVFQGGRTGVTWGRKVAKTRLIREDTGQPLGPALAFGRHLLHFLDSITCLVGWLFPLWDQKRQTLSDKIIRSVVIDDPTV